jgi:nucleotide-binding universal stress UspA family protein
MDYKTILVHCNDQRRIKTLLAPAVKLAETFQSHLVGLSVVPPVAIVPTGAPLGPPIVIDAHCELYRTEDNPAMKAAFEATARGRGLVSEWREDDAEGCEVADRVLPQAFAADLVVASQADPAWPGSERLDIADRLAMESGRPVLIVPSAGAHERIGERVLVAWNAKREAVRAAWDALPILQRAKEVKVVWVNPQSERERTQDVPAADICTALARQGVKCEATEQIAPRAAVGETLLGYAEAWKADLLVMGCYGHTRLLELILGGASRHVLSHMTLPVLMSH